MPDLGKLTAKSQEAVKNRCGFINCAESLPFVALRRLTKHMVTPPVWPLIAVFIAFIFIAAATVYWIISRSRRTARLVEPDHADHRRVFSGLPLGEFILVDGFKIRFIQKGAGPDVLLLHGLCESIVTWRLNFNDLAKHYRVTAFDLPGFGFSSKLAGEDYGLDSQSRRVFEFMDRLNIVKPYLVAHSMGAAVAAWMAKSEPTKINKIALLAPAVNRAVIWFHPRAAEWFGNMVRPFIITPTLIRRVYLKQCVVEPPPDFEEAIPEFYRPFHNSPDSVKTLLRHNWLLNDKRLPKGLAQLECPVLVIAGEDDRIVKLKLMDEFLQLNPDAQFVVFSNTGHQIHEEKPTEVLTALCDFFDSPMV